MKTNLLFFIAVVILSVTNSLQAQQIIHSTTTGGNWTDNKTWVTSMPGPLDSVVLHGPVGLGYGLNGFCTSLNITSTASFGGSVSSGSGQLNISGSIYNNGDIVGKNVYYLKGNIVNNKPWRGADNRIVFSGMDHTISCAPGAKLNARLQADDSLQNFTLLSNVTIDTNCVSDLGFSQLNAGNHKLHNANGGFANCRIHSLDTLQFDSWISNLELTGDYKLKGNMDCQSYMAFFDHATNCGNIVGSATLQFKGDFTNKGTLNNAMTQVEKNITNHGIWNSYRTEFTGAGDKHISQSAGHPFGGGEKFMSDNSGSKIFLDTDVEFTVPTFQLNNNTLNCGGHILTANTTFYDGTINSEAEIKGNSDFWNTTFTGDVILSGNNRFANPTMNGVIYNTGMMKDITYYGGFFTSYNHLINRNSIQSLQLKIFGDLTNYGTIDNNSTVEITGNITQYINFTKSIESPVHFFSNKEGNSYQWMKDGSDLQNQVSQKLSFSSLQLTDAGVYKCRVITGDGTTVFSREITVNNTTSVAEDERIDGCKIFPNPFVAHATLQWEQKSVSKVRIDIIDMNGKLITTVSNSVHPVGKNEVEFAADSKMLPGVYYLRLVVNGKIQTRKLYYIR